MVHYLLVIVGGEQTLWADWIILFFLIWCLFIIYNNL